MRSMQGRYGQVEKETYELVSRLIGAHGVPSSLEEADVLAGELYPLVLQQRRSVWAREVGEILVEFPDMVVPEPRHYPVTALQKLVRRTVGLAPNAQGVAVNELDPITQSMVARTLAPWTAPDDNVIVLETVRRLSAGTARHIKASSRDTVMDTAKENNVGWARQLSGSENCPFCAMLVSRGPVYSEETAFFQSHDNCDCTATLVKPGKSWDGEDDFKQMEDLWIQSGDRKTFNHKFREIMSEQEGVAA